MDQNSAVMAQLNKLEGKIDRVLERQNAIDVTLGKQQVSLDDHIRRTELLEEAVEVLKKEQEPLARRAHAWAFIGKGITYAGAATALILGLIKLASMTGLLKMLAAAAAGQ